ncbi:exodeoxyribonuclease VII small subunit [Bradyrhizobium sp. RDT10]
MPNKQHPAAFCPRHGLFQAPGFGLGEDSSITFINCQTSCFVPGCIQNCEIIPGKYSAGKKSLNLLIDPSISKEALAAITEIATRLQAGKISIEEAQKEVESVAPEAKGLFKGWTRSEVIAMAGAIIAAAALLKPSAAPVVHVQPVIERVVKPVPDWLSSSGLTKVPLPKPRPKGR